MPAHSVRGLARTVPTAAIVLVRAEASDETVARAIGEGASGYLIKGVEPDELVAAVRAAAEGALVFGKPLAGRLGAMLASCRVDASRLGTLSRRERDVLELLKTGRGNAAIGRSLGVTAKTVANHVSSMLSKLRVTSRTELIELAHGSGPDAPASVVRLHLTGSGHPGEHPVPPSRIGPQLPTVIHR